MARSHASDDENTQTHEQYQPANPAAAPAGLEARITKLEEQLAKLMPRIEALTGPL